MQMVQVRCKVYVHVSEYRSWLDYKNYAILYIQKLHTASILLRLCDCHILQGNFIGTVSILFNPRDLNTIEHMTLG